MRRWVTVALEECERFYPAFQFVIWGGKDAAGALDAPGRGFLFRMPIQTGLINIGSTFGTRYAASIPQIIAAIARQRIGPKRGSLGIFFLAPKHPAGKIHSPHDYRRNIF